MSKYFDQAYASMYFFGLTIFVVNYSVLFPEFLGINDQ